MKHGNLVYRCAFCSICWYMYIYLCCLEINPILFTAELTLTALASLKKSENAN